MPFEPTAGRPALSKSNITELNPGNRSEVADLPPVLMLEKSYFPWRQLVVGILFSISILGLGWIGFDEIKMRSSPTSSTAGNIYLRLRRLGTPYVSPAEPGDTPYEFSSKLIGRLRMVSKTGISEGYISEINEDLSGLMNMVVKASYKPMKAGESGLPIFKRWKSLRWRLSLMWVLRIYQIGYDLISGKIKMISRDMRSEESEEDEL